MTFEVIENPDFKKFKRQSGFTNGQFRKLAGLYSRAAAAKALYDIAVDVDFDTHVCKFTYFESNNYIPTLQFVIRQVGPRTDMYEIYKYGKGRICRSGLFDRAFERLAEEIEALMDA